MRDFIKLLILMTGLSCLIFACALQPEKVRVIEIGGKNIEEKETLPDSEKEAESENKSLTDSEAEQGEEGKETDPEGEKETGAEAELETEPQPEVGPEPESEGENGSETESENEPEPEPENQPEPEPEPLPELDPMPQIPDPAKLTLVVYMAADNDLESYALSNLKAMEHSHFDNMNVLVLLDRAEGYDETNDDWTDTRLFELEHDDTDGNLIVSKRLSCPLLGLSNRIETELDMGNPSVLWNLLSFAVNNYESEKYALIIWGHGTGWRYSLAGTGNSQADEASSVVRTDRAVAIDDRSGSYMSVHDLGRALKGKGLSVIGFDTCFGGVFENVYELKNYADYTVASPGITPSTGWDYKRLLEDLSESDFYSKTIADAMADSAVSDISIFNNLKLPTLMTDLESFSKALADTIRNNSDRKTAFNKLLEIKSYSYTQYPCDLYLDIYSMADLYKSNSDKTLAAAAKKLMKTVNSAASTPRSDNAGIGIHLIPKTGANITASVHSSDYIKDSDNAGQCQFIRESLWWVPTKGGESGSLLDKLFYEKF